MPAATARHTACLIAGVLAGSAMRLGSQTQSNLSADAFRRFESVAGAVHVADSEYHVKSYDLAAAAYARIADDWIHPDESHYNAACSYALAGHPDAAIAELRRALASGYREAQQLRTDPDLLSLHTRPEWPGLLNSVDGAVATFRRTHGDPSRAKLVTSDIPRFWQAFDQAQQAPTPADRAAIYRSQYFSGGSIGLADYFLVKIRSVEGFTGFVDRTHKYYASIRASTMQVATDVSAIRAVLHRMKELYPQAVFPDIYFVIGRLSSGGTSTETGLLLGSEMFSSTPASPRDEIINKSTRDFLGTPDMIPTIVAHELVHFEQSQAGQSTLLRGVLVEGGANFIAKLITGRETDSASMRFGREHESLVWTRFQRDMHGTDDGYWIANGGSDRVGEDWMHDMGYFIGFQIAEAYYAQAQDKKEAIRDLLELKDPDALLRASGYGSKLGK